MMSQDALTAHAQHILLISDSIPGKTGYRETGGKDHNLKVIRATGECTTCAQEMRPQHFR